MPTWIPIFMSVLQMLTMIIAVIGFFVSRGKEHDERITAQANANYERKQLRETLESINTTMRDYNTRLSAVELIVELMASQHKANHNQDIGGVL